MSTLLRGLVLMATAGALTFPTNPPASVQNQSLNAPAGRGRSIARSTPGATASTRFTPAQLEFYQTDDGIAYIRPGLKVTVNSVTLGTDRKPVVDFTLTDSLDQPLDRLGKTTPGAISLGFLVGWYNPTTREYVNYLTRNVTAPANSPRPGAQATQAVADSNGKYVDLGGGHYTYTFGNALPAGFDATKTHTVGIYGARNLADLIDKYYFSNVEYDFRPDGQTLTTSWDKIKTAACNQCHDPLKAHGETGRQEVKLCAMCHTSQTVDPDTGNTVDLDVMIHKIHRSENLPSVKAGTPYVIIGFGQGVNDFSHTTYPQDIRNCQTCHEYGNPTQKDVWMTAPTRQACGSCHDDINWATGAGHPGGAATDDSACASCHIPDSGAEWDASVKAAHTVPLKSKQLPGLTATIVSTSNVAAGKTPTVVFNVKSGGTSIDATKLNSFSPMWAVNTGSYYAYGRESGLATGTNPGSYDPATGNTTFTFKTAIPADAKGSVGITLDSYKTYALKRADGKADITNVRDAVLNPISYVSLTGGIATPRRTSVTMAQCNQCHNDLRAHGSQRRKIEECVMCHNPVKTDNATPAESVSFQRMIHRIHTGEELTQPYVVSGTSFNEVTFPGDRRNCQKCHTATGYLLPLATSAQPVTTPTDYFSPQGPGTAACLGCHDNKDAAAHAYLNTTTFPGQTVPQEACATCHGTGKTYGVDKVHAR